MPHAIGSMSHLQTQQHTWRPPLEVVPAGQCEGRRLLKARDFAGAVAALAAQVLEDKGCNLAPIPAGVSTAGWPQEAIAISTRLLLCKAQAACGDLQAALDSATEAVTATRLGGGVLVPLDGPLMSKALFTIAQLHNEGQGTNPAGLRAGVQACQELRAIRQADSQAAERAKACEIQSELHRKLCCCLAVHTGAVVEAHEVATASETGTAANSGTTMVCGSTASRALPAVAKGIRPCTCGAMAAALGALQACVDAGEIVINAKGRGGVTRQHQLRITALRELRIRLGLIDVAAEAADVLAAEEIKAEKARERTAGGRGSKGSRKRARFAASLDEQLLALHGEVEERHTTLAALCLGRDDAGAVGQEHPPRIDWEAVPLVLRPSSLEDGGLGQSGTARVQRKEWQLESIFTVLRGVLSVIEEPGHPLHIVDFGSGCGNSVLPFAALLPKHRFTVSPRHKHEDNKREGREGKGNEGGGRRRGNWGGGRRVSTCFFVGLMSVGSPLSSVFMSI